MREVLTEGLISVSCTEVMSYKSVFLRLTTL